MSYQRLRDEDDKAEVQPNASHAAEKPRSASARDVMGAWWSFGHFKVRLNVRSSCHCYRFNLRFTKQRLSAKYFCKHKMAEDSAWFQDVRAKGGKVVNGEFDVVFSLVACAGVDKAGL